MREPFGDWGSFVGKKEAQRRMTRNNSDRLTSLPDEIRRQFGAPATTRFLRALPSFQIDPRTEEHFSELLEELEIAEGRRANSVRRRQG
jgi:hypothetical protein